MRTFEEYKIKHPNVSIEKKMDAYKKWTGRPLLFLDELDEEDCADVAYDALLQGKYVNFLRKKHALMGYEYVDYENWNDK